MRDEGGHDEAAAAAAARAAAAAAAAEAGDNPPAGDTLSAEDAAQLRADLAAARADAARFNGIDPEAARANATRVAELDAANRTAEAERARAEGNFERLRELQNEEHQAALAAANSERDAARQERAQAVADAAAARRSAAFASSRFFADETILTPAKAERLYGDFTETENGVVVVYDAPTGAAKRTKVMDTKGNALPFDAAIKKVIDAEADKDTFLKSKVKPGAGSTTTDGRPTTSQDDRLSRLSQGLAKLRER